MRNISNFLSRRRSQRRPLRKISESRKRFLIEHATELFGSRRRRASRRRLLEGRRDSLSARPLRSRRSSLSSRTRDPLLESRLNRIKRRLRSRTRPILEHQEHPSTRTRPISTFGRGRRLRRRSLLSESRRPSPSKVYKKTDDELIFEQYSAHR